MLVRLLFLMQQLFINEKEPINFMIFGSMHINLFFIFFFFLFHKKVVRSDFNSCHSFWNDVLDFISTNCSEWKFLLTPQNAWCTLNVSFRSVLIINADNKKLHLHQYNFVHGLCVYDYSHLVTELKEMAPPFMQILLQHICYQVNPPANTQQWCAS